MTVKEALIARIAEIKAEMPTWFGGKPLLKLPLSTIYIDNDRTAAYVTLEDLAAAFSDGEQDRGSNGSEG